MSLVQLECGYIYRGCEYTPARRDYEDHMLGCLYQPKVVGCGHEVNLGDEERHCEVCNEFPMPCDKCGYLFTRGGLLGHRCFPFLHGLIDAQGGEIKAQNHQIVSLEHKITSQDNKITSQDNKITVLEHIIEGFQPHIVHIKSKYIYIGKINRGTKETTISCGRKETEINSGRKEREINSGRKETEINSGRKETEINSGRKETEINSGRKETEINSGRKETEINGGRKETEINSGRKKGETNRKGEEIIKSKIIYYNIYRLWN